MGEKCIQLLHFSVVLLVFYGNTPAVGVSSEVKIRCMERIIGGYWAMREPYEGEAVKRGLHGCTGGGLTSCFYGCGKGVIRTRTSINFVLYYYVCNFMCACVGAL